ncbi:polyadenylate-binding protein-interacting protein 1 isoform X2 [Periplaneta americana]|uniref:polyadenylate-binding protein-interacting protein 1 isoform X2 n=1 Tax=Periplaneta americana TaxID=6978 RepID=UPI0037E8C23E
MHPAGEHLVPRGRGRGPWRQGQEHRELRRPQSDNRIGFAANNSNSIPDPGAGGDVSRNSTLSATAKEFYPKGYQTHPVEDGYNSSYQFEETPPEGGDCLRYNLASPTSQTTPEQVATNHLIEVMQHLTLNPGKFDVLITPLVHTFSLWLGDKNIVYSIVNAIVEQSITEPNFRYNGARLCNFLNNEFPPGDKSTFRSCLLSRCQEEHIRVPTYIHSDPRRLHGYVLFVAELFMQLELAKGYGDRITILGTALLEALSSLLTEPSSENIKCVCQVLKLTGQPLDAQEPLAMNQIMHSLSELFSNSNVEPNIRHLIHSVIELRTIRWGDASNFMPHASTTQVYNSCPPQNEPVFYGPDGQIMTPEESQFLQENVERIPDIEEYDEYSEDGLHVWEQDDEMDEEIQAAYEQFLQMGKNQSRDNKTTNKSSG